MSADIHEAARTGFARAGEDYERGRPGYPAAAVAALAAELRIEPGTTVLDLAAGTGKLTALLAPLGAELVAVEPVAGMRERLQRLLPGARALEGTAEHIPLPEDSVDAVVVAQAFHWFDAPRAAAEIHRVLRPAGALGVIWNAWLESVPWVGRVQARVHEHVDGAPQHATSPWPAQLEATGLFSALRERSFPNPVRGDLETLLARVSSVSYIAALDDARRARLRADVTAIVAADPQTRGHAEFEMPYTTHLVICRAR